MAKFVISTQSAPSSSGSSSPPSPSGSSGASGGGSSKFSTGSTKDSRGGKFSVGSTKDSRGEKTKFSITNPSASQKSTGGKNGRNDAVGKAGGAIDATDNKGRTAHSYLRDAAMGRHNANSGKVTAENFDSKLQQALSQYNGYFDTFQNTFGERQDLTEDDRRRMQMAGFSTLNNGEFGNGLEDWKTYGEGQERQIKAQTAELRKFLDDNADLLNADAASEIRSVLDQMDDYSGQLWRAAYNDEGLQARDAYRRTGNAYTIAEKAYNEAQKNLEDVIQNTPSDADYDKAVETAREEAKAAEEALRLARDAYEKAGGLGRSYSAEDRASDTLKGSAKDYAASLTGAARAVAELGAAKSPEAQQNALRQYSQDVDTAQRAYDAALKANGGDTSAEQVILAKRDLDTALSAFNAQTGRVTGEAEALQGFADRAQGTYDRLAGASAMDISRAKNGASDLTRFLVDAGVAGTEMLGDAAIGAVTFGALSPKTMMAIRVFGKSAQEAKEGGGDIDQQILYGGGAALLEVATESMFDGLAGLYGAGGADEVVEKVIGRLAKNPAVRNAMRLGFGAAGEAAEEAISGVVSPALRTIYSGESLKSEYSKEKAEDVLYDALVGGFLGLAGGGVGMANGQYAQANAQIDLNNAMNRAGISTASQAQNAMDVLSGRATPEQMAQRESAAQATLAENMGGTDALSQYINNQRLGNYQNVQAAQTTTATQALARRAVAEVLAQGRVNNTAATAILNDPELRAAAEYQTGLSFEGMTTEEARTELQRAARRGAYTTSQFNAQEARAAEAENARAQAALEEEAARNNANNYDSYIRGVLRTGANTETANEILNDENLIRVWERLAQKPLPRDKSGEIVRKSALKMLRETTRANVDINVDSAIAQYIAERNTPPQTAPEAAETQGTPTGEITQPALQTDATAQAVELNSSPTPAVEAQTAGTVTAPTAEPVTETTTVETPQEVTEQLPTVNEDATAKEVPSQSNSIAGQESMYGIDYEAPNHISKPEVESLTNAMNRASSDMNGEMQKLMGKDAWTGEDLDTALVINGKLLVDAIKNNDFSAVDAWNKVLEPHKSEAGRALQALSKWARGGRAVIADTRAALAKSGLSDAQQAGVLNKVMEFADRYDTVENGDLESIRKLILDMNSERGTGTFIPGEFEKLLNKETDFDYLKEFAMRQLMAIPNESINKPDLGQRLKTWQSLAQLLRITTTLRNVLGNETFSIIDFVPQNTVGTWVDALLSAVDGTGVRTVGMSSSWLDSDARKAEAKAIDRSMMEIAGDVFMGGENAYNTQGPRTFKMSDSNVLHRVLSRAEQLSGYALQTTDEAASARQMTAYMNMLERLNGEKMSAEQREELAKAIADYRLFKNKGLVRNASQGLHDAMNRVGGIGGKITESGLLRRGGFGVAELLGFSYPGVPANLGVKPLEYSPLNAAKGIVEMVKYFGDKNANGSPNLQLRQQAAMDFARGVTGTAMIAALSALFRSGVFKNFDDEDDDDVRAQNRAEGKTGTLINLSAAERLFRGESPIWRNGDRYMNIAYLEPLNALMAISDYISKDMKDDGVTAVSLAKDFFKGEWNGLLDMPVMQSIASLADIINTKYDEETGGSKLIDSIASIAGNAATGMIPGLLSQGAKAMDNVERDTSADTVWGQTVNAAKNAIPGLRQTLPVKYDALGNPIALPGSNTADRVANALLRPGVMGNLQQSEASQLIADLIDQTGNKSIMPDSRAPYSINIDGEKTELTAEERQKFKRDYGSTIADLLEGLARDPSFQRASAEEQASVLKDLEKYAKDRAKAAATEGRGAEYTSDIQTLLDGKKSPSGTKDTPKLQEQNVGEYFSFTTRLEDAQKSGDYATIDQLLADYAGLSKNTKAVMDAKGQADLKSLLAFKAAGSSAESLYKLKDAIGEEQWNLGIDNNTGGHVKLAGLGSADIPDAEKDALVKSGAYGMSKTAKATYQILRSYGYSPADVSAWFENADWYSSGKDRETGELIPPKADNSLNAYEVAVGISKLPGLSDEQQNAMYQAFKDALQVKGDQHDTWKRRTYHTSLRVSTNYGRTTGKSDDMDIGQKKSTFSIRPQEQEEETGRKKISIR